MENSFNQDIMARYLTGNCTHDDLSQLLAWIKAAPENMERFESMVGLHEKVAGLQVSDAQKQAALRRLMRRIEGEKPALRRLNSRRWIGYAALFLVMIGLGATLLFNHRSSHKQLITAQATTAIRKITLNDGTQVWLNKGAKLTYPPSFDGKERTRRPNQRLVRAARRRSTDRTSPSARRPNVGRRRVLRPIDKPRGPGSRALKRK